MTADTPDRATDVTPVVTVVVPVYNPGPNIDGLLASLRAQTLPPGALEVVLVDDGGTDGTLQRLQRLAEDRPYLVVRSIPNSGWPGRPRNVGLDAARGEFVFFADHDDELWPDALEQLLATARRNDADVVYPKVVRRGLSTPYWELAHRDVEVADLVGDQLVVSRSVHKLYRRSFLTAHGIRFPEGRVRLEDHHFMGQVLSRRPRVSIVASRPGYVWIHRPDKTNTSTMPVDLTVYFGYVAQSVDLLLAGAGDDLRRQVADVSLARIFLPLRADTWVARSPEEQRAALAAVADFLDAHVPRELEDRLPRLKQWSVQAVHAGDVDLYGSLVQLRASLRQTVSVESVRWRETEARPVLDVQARSIVTDVDGEPVTLPRRDGAVVLPATMGAPPQPGDDSLTSADLGSGELTIRHRETGVEWPLHGSAEPDQLPLPDGVALGMRLQAALDPVRDYFGHDLATGIWDVLARVDVLGERQVPRVRVAPGTALPALQQVGDRQVQVYRTAGGTLALKVRDPLTERAAKPRVTGVTWQDTGVRLQLGRDAAPDATAVVVRVRGSRPADVLAALPIDAGAVVLELPELAVGTVLDLWARTGSGREQRLAHDVQDGSEPAGSGQGTGWRAYATDHGSFSLKRVASSPSGRRSPLRRLLGR
jgi:hypothetical protein